MTQRKYFVLAALGAVGFEAFVLVKPGSRTVFTITEGVLLGVAGGLGGLSCLRRARRESDGTRRGWTGLGLALLLVGLGLVLTGVETASLGHFPGLGQSLTDVPSVLAVLCAVAGMVAFAGPTVTSRRLAFLDAATVTTAMVFVGWAAALGPMSRTRHLGAQQLTALVYVGGVIALLALVLVTAMRWRGDGPTLVLLGTGFAISTVANTALTGMDIRGEYQPGDWRIDIAWFVTFALIGLAAALPSPGREFDLRRRWWLATLPPYIGVVLVVGTSVVVIVTSAPFDGVLVTGGAVMIALMLVRQLLTLHEHSVLAFDLEQRVQERTAATTEHATVLGAMLRDSPDAIAVVDLSGSFVYASRASESLLGVPVHSLLGSCLLDLVHPEDVAGLRAAVVEVAGEGVGPRLLSFRLWGADAQWRAVEASASAVSQSSLGTSVELNIRDVSERVALQEQLQRHATFDALTSLPNRRVFEDRLQHALDKVARSGEDLAVLYIDLDDFKRINDTLGHTVGDDLLSEVADRLRSVLRPADTAARLGGDEFAILLEGASENQAREVADRVVAACAPPYQLAGHSLIVTASVGVTSAGSGRLSPLGLVHDADVAMYRAKAAGRGRVEVFDAAMDEERRMQHELEQAVRRSIEGDGLVIVYQPVLDLTSGTVVGMESLARWVQEPGSQFPSDRFLSVAEQRGIGPDLDRRVLREATRQARRWQVEVPGYGDLQVHVNVLPSALRHRVLVDHVGHALEESSLDPKALVIEISETGFVSDDAEAVRVLAALEGMGVQVLLDDFGTGSTSLVSLQRTPLHGVKIDPSLIDRLDADPGGWMLVHGVVEICHAMGLSTTAEGVERRRQADRAKEIGCDFAQGWFYGRPLDAADVPACLASRPSRTVTQSSPRLVGDVLP